MTTRRTSPPASQWPWPHDVHTCTEACPKQCRQWSVEELKNNPPETCGATDGLGLFPDEPEKDCYGRCTLPPRHDTNGWHQEWRNGRLWAEWRGPYPGEKCNICGKDGSVH